MGFGDSLRARALVVGLLLLGAGAPASAAGAKTDAEVVESFRKELEKAGKLDKSLEAQLLNVSRHEFVHRALLATDETYREAVRAPSLEAWDALLANKPSRFAEAEGRFRRARVLLLLDEYEKAAAELETMGEKLGEFTTRNAESRLLLAYAYGKLEDTGRARRILADMLKSYPEAPERYREMAHWLLRELKGQGTGPLLELSKAMEVIRRNLRRAETGFNPTQQRQKEVVKELDRLIKLLEDKKKGGGDCKDCKKPGQKKSQKQCDKPGQGNPMQDSKLPGGSPEPKNLKGEPKREVSEFWGGLREMERDKVLQVLKERFPSQYKEIIEQYYRSLGEKGATPSAPGDEAE